MKTAYYALAIFASAILLCACGSKRSSDSNNEGNNENTEAVDTVPSSIYAKAEMVARKFIINSPLDQADYGIIIDYIADFSKEAIAYEKGEKCPDIESFVEKYQYVDLLQSVLVEAINNQRLDKQNQEKLSQIDKDYVL